MLMEQKISSIKYFLLCQDWDGNHFQQSNMKQSFSGIKTIKTFVDQKVRAKKLNFQQVYKILCPDFSVNKYNTYKITTRPRNVTCKIFWEWNQLPVLSSVCPVCPVSDVCVSVSPLSSSFFAAIKNIFVDQDCDYTKLKNLLLFGVAASVGLGTWFSLAHDALIVLHKKLQWRFLMKSTRAPPPDI